MDTIFEAVFQQCVGRPDDVRTAALLAVEGLTFTRDTPFADFKGAALYAVHQALDTSPPVILRSTGANFIVKALPLKVRDQLVFRLNDEEKIMSRLETMYYQAEPEGGKTKENLVDCWFEGAEDDAEEGQVFSAAPAPPQMYLQHCVWWD